MAMSSLACCIILCCFFFFQMVVVILTCLEQIGINVGNFPFYLCELLPWRIKRRRKISSFASTLQCGSFHNKSQGDFKSFKVWGQRIKSPPRLKRRGQQKQLLQKKISKTFQHYSEGAHSKKLGFGANVRINERKESNEKK